MIKIFFRSRAYLTRLCVAAGTALLVGLSAPGVGYRAEAAEAWEAEWKALIAKAKAEGKLTVALGGSASRNLRPAYKAFEKKFGIDVALGGGSGALVTSRLTSERAAGVYAVDVVQIGVASVNKVLLANDFLQPIPPLFLLPEVKDEAKWLDGHHWWGDPDSKRYVFYFSLPQGEPSIAINTNMVNPDEINSYYDVFNSKYDGLRVSGSMELSEGAHSIARMWMIVGKDWLKKWIVDAKPVFSSDSDVITNWLIQGKYGIAMFSGGSGEMALLDDLRKKGAPVLRMTKIMKEGIDSNPGSSGNFTIVKNAPHPAATKLFVNWFLSREGQLAMQNGYFKGDSLRIDIPKDMISPRWRREPGQKYRVLTTEPEYDKILNEGIAYVKELKRSVGIAAPKKLGAVEAKITGIERKGRSISFNVGGGTHTVSVSRSRTLVSIGGNKVSREQLKVGMTCTFDYPGNKKRAKSISCK
jgi:iron(III) transport system substrate-binding protein